MLLKLVFIDILCYTGIQLGAHSMSIELRDYQQEAVDAVISEFKNGVTKQLVALPCGTGKTVIFSALIKHFNTKTLVIAHRTELLKQASDKLKRFWPEAPIGFFNAEQKDIQKQVVIASIQSVSRIPTVVRIGKAGFKLLIIDEAHHSPADSYMRLIKCVKPDLLIGVTATPERGDKKSLEKCFDKIVYSKEIPEMIDAGWLCQVEGRKIATYVSLDDVKTRMGDYAVDELEKVINIKERNKLIVTKYKKHAKNRKTVAFCNSVEHCIELAKEFHKRGVKAEAIYGAMPTDKREKILEDLARGRLKVVTSCNVLTEGFDEPSVNCIIMARPTKSRPLYIQMAGRGFRPSKGKKNCLVLDFIDQDHRLRSRLTLKGIVPKAVETRDDPKADEEERLEEVRAKEEDRKRKKRIEDRRLDLLAKEAEEKKKEARATVPPNVIVFKLPNGSKSLVTNEGIEFVVTSLPDSLLTMEAYDKKNTKVFQANKNLTIEEADSTLNKVIKNNYLTVSYFDTNSSYFTYSLDADYTKPQLSFLLSLVPLHLEKDMADLLNLNPFFATKAGMSLAIQQMLCIKKYCERNKIEKSSLAKVPMDALKSLFDELCEDPEFEERFNKEKLNVS